MIFSPIVVIPMVLPFHTKPYRSILIVRVSLPISELDGGICQLKRNVAVFSIGEPSGYTKCNSCAAKTKTSFLYKPSVGQMILFIHLRVPSVLYHNHSIDRVIIK